MNIPKLKNVESSMSSAPIRGQEAFRNAHRSAGSLCVQSPPQYKYEVLKFGCLFYIIRHTSINIISSMWQSGSRSKHGI